jgi:hypothetical protein
MEIGGVSVEVPSGDEWHVQIVRDPCYGDGRYFVLVENRTTKDRVRVDMVEPKVTSEVADPVRLESMTERVLRSVKGAYQVPIAIQTFGPLPTGTTCDPNAVPTLIVDDFTPPPAEPDAATPVPSTGRATAEVHQ